VPTEEVGNVTDAAGSAGKRRKLIGFSGEGQGLLAVPHYIGDKAHPQCAWPNRGTGPVLR